MKSLTGQRYGLRLILTFASLSFCLGSISSAHAEQRINLKRVVNQDDFGMLSNHSGHQRERGAANPLGISRNDSGDVTLIVKGMAIDVSYNDVLPAVEFKEQYKRISMQEAPFINGVSVRVNIPF